MGRDDEKAERHEARVLPAREVMSLISPGATSVPGLGGLLGTDPTGGATAPAGGATDLASGAAHHAADGQQPAPVVSDQPTDTSSSSTQTASSET
jgi:hypothetical protein